MAPEIVTGTIAYTVKADVWSTGVTACELLAAKAPFGRPSDYKGKFEPVLQNIRDYNRFKGIEKRLERSDLWRSRSAMAKDFVASILHREPTDRPHADQALDHDWLVRNKAVPEAMSLELVNSMRRFTNASSLMRRCLLIIAARVGSPRMDRIGAVYLSIDIQHSGRVSREDVAAAVGAAASCWQPELDVDDFFDAADQDQREVISFLEFASTCIWGTDDTTNTIAERAFNALDDDHDGLVRLEDCRNLFRDRDLMELRSLPVNRAFGLNEWCMAVGGTDAPVMKKQAAEPQSMLARFIRTLMCSEDEPHAEDDFEVVCR
jgi:calcium-dependent protein kinase